VQSVVGFATFCYSSCRHDIYPTHKYKKGKEKKKTHVYEIWPHRKRTSCKLLALFSAREMDAVRRDSDVVQPQFQPIVPVPIGSHVFINPNAVQTAAPLVVCGASGVRGRVSYGRLPYGRRVRFTFWGNPLVRVITVFWLVLFVVGVVLTILSPTVCPSDCLRQVCASNAELPCTCGDPEICMNTILGPQGQAGIVLIVIAALGIISQSLFACPCCLCWVPTNPFYVDD
jgi:hypothetical protein